MNSDYLMSSTIHPLNNEVMQEKTNKLNQRFTSTMEIEPDTETKGLTLSLNLLSRNQLSSWLQISVGRSLKVL